jgi:hypothetical protein
VLTPRPTFADRMNALVEQLTLAIAAAQAAHSEARQIHRDSCIADQDLTAPSSQTYQAYYSFLRVGEVLSDLNALRDRL